MLITLRSEMPSSTPLTPTHGTSIADEGDLVVLNYVPRGGATSPPPPAVVVQELDAELRRRRAIALNMRFFGDLELASGVFKACQRLDGGGAPAPTLVEGSPLGASGLAGVHVLAIRDERGMSRLGEREGEVLGRIVETEGAEFLSLSDVGRLVRRGGQPRGRVEEVAETFRAAEGVMQAEGWSFRDVVRTWFYLRDILDWYGDFNRVRNETFARMGLAGPGGCGTIPASTGIEGRGARGGWCTLDLLAVRPRAGHAFGVRRLANTRQNEATEYGSAFARGVELVLDSTRYVFVSGTASIDDHGRSVDPGDFEAQTRRTLESVSSLLAGAGGGLEDVRQATAFVKNPSDAGSYERIARESGLAAIPAVATVADVCRDELLFELDATAVLPVATSRNPAA